MVSVVAFAGLVLAGRSGSNGLLRAMGNLAQVIHLVDTKYVDPVNLAALGEGLDAGLVESVDPEAAVLDPSEAAAFRELADGPPPFGLILGLRLGSAAVRQALPGSPAAAVKLKPWEVIEEIDGIPTRGYPLWRARLNLAEYEKKGKPVRLKVFGRDMENRREVELTPEPWKVQNLRTEDRDGVRVVEVLALGPGAAKELEAAVGRGARILDLRHLVWGSEEEAVDASDLFVGDGVVARWKGRRAGERSFESKHAQIGGPLPVVMIGPDTEDVGEILAAGLRRAGCTLIGGRSMGHAPHMVLIHDGDLTLWLPVGRWLRADGKPIAARGIDPDEKIEVKGEGGGEESGKGQKDPVLDRALELARTRHGKAA
ncbi:MAG: hypothetical protein GXP47_03690 [Acidobacteria bacterium]|nr:hypothetical protein [Acidobacteriota bacterium]